MLNLIGIVGRLFSSMKLTIVSPMQLAHYNESRELRLREEFYARN